VARRHVGLILLLAVACALGAATGSAYADGGTTTTTTTTAEPTIAAGVLIGPVAVGGMTQDGATQAVLQAFGQPLLLQVGHHRVSVAPKRFHQTLPAAAAVQTALTAAPDTAIPLQSSVNLQRVARYVAGLAKQSNVAPQAGALVLRNDRPAFSRGHAGRSLRLVPSEMRIRDAIQDAARTAPVVLPFKKLVAPKQQSLPVIVIHRGLNRLMLFDGTRFVRTFPVATGQAIYPTPLGRFQIVVKEKNPWWYPPTYDSWAKGLKPVPPGPNNPLGTRWMGLSAPGVGIHGTDEPTSIGYSESHGCIRMQVPDAEWLFNRVQVGTTVFIVPS
jgi:lipoprotein-anchoring transpeptidase ErfK/SrfK